jgi:hypothetical protein
MDTTAASEYREAIERVFAGGDVRLFNGNIHEASAAVEQAFLHGRKEIKILSNRLLPECYGTDPVLKAASKFLMQHKRATLQILVEDPATQSAPTNPFLLRIYQVAPDRVRIRRVPPDISAQYDYNFLTVDDAGYRFEEDRRSPVAVVAGGQTSRIMTKRLSEIFDAIWEMSPTPAEEDSRAKAYA